MVNGYIIDNDILKTFPCSELTHVLSDSSSQNVTHDAFLTEVHGSINLPVTLISNSNGKLNTHEKMCVTTFRQQDLMPSMNKYTTRFLLGDNYESDEVFTKTMTSPFAYVGMSKSGAKILHFKCPDYTSSQVLKPSNVSYLELTTTCKSKLKVNSLLIYYS